VKDSGGLVVSQGGLGKGSFSSSSSDPSGDKEEGSTGIPPQVGGDQDNPSLSYARGGFSGSPDSQMGGLTDAIVRSSPFLNDHRSFYLAQNATPTDLRALQRVGSDVLNPIARQVTGDATSGRSAFDGQSAELPKDVKRRCSTNFFGQSNCAQ
jgi:hypothetical protein